MGFFFRWVRLLKTMNFFEKCRNEKKLSLNDVAKMTGLSKATLSRIENNRLKSKKTPSVKVIFILSTIYDYDPFFVCNLIGYKKQEVINFYEKIKYMYDIMTYQLEKEKENII